MRVDHITEEQWPAYLEELLATDATAVYEPEINNWHTMLEMEALASWDREASPEGDRWEAWRWRRLEFHHIAKPLLNTGRLYDSFVRGTSENRDKVTAREGEYGSDVPYAGVHQFGGEVEVKADLRRRVTLEHLLANYLDVPARPMLGVREDMVDVFVDSIADSLVEQMKG